MKTIYKYPVEIQDRSIIDMPVGAEILSVRTQDGKPMIWAMVDTDAKVEPRYIEVFGTGHPIHVDMGIDRKFIGTFLINNDGLVFHLFERL